MSGPTHSDTLRRMYDAFNARDTNGVFAYLAEDVDWPNGMEGGREHGKDAVRAYWKHQWSIVDPHVLLERVTADEEGRAVAQVHQIVRDARGRVLFDGRLLHIFTFRDGLVTTMDILSAEDASRTREQLATLRTHYRSADESGAADPKSK